MDWTRAIRGALGVLVALALSASGPAFASSAAPNALAPDAVTCTPGAQACPIRITFAHGAYSGQAHSQLTGITSQKWFVVNAHEGQAMIIIIKGAGPTRGTVHFPGGGSSGQPGGRVFDEVLSSSGDYRIRVTESQMGEEWSRWRRCRRRDLLPAMPGVPAGWGGDDRYPHPAPPGARPPGDNDPDGAPRGSRRADRPSPGLRAPHGPAPAACVPARDAGDA